MSESIGNKLKAARESRRLTLDQAADSTRVRAVYLQALENNDHSVMLSAAQGRGFLRIYADFLGLNLDNLTAAARESRPPASSAPVVDSTPPTEPTPETTPIVPGAKPSRPGFWARLLRREPAAVGQQPVPEEPASSIEPVVAPAAIEVEEPLKPRKTPTKKPARKKTTPTEVKSKTAPRKPAASKKKRTTSRSSKR
ncbi:MAG: hypothetical protein HFACDABA_01654 [Anaerolineales bacterium]|nr:hypothetical protein [Anaerolineales bacterium]